MSGPLQVAAGWVDISPRRLLPLAGNATRRARIPGRLADPLEVNALVLRLGDARVALVSFDLLYVSRPLREGLLQRLGPGWREEDLFLAASHTHFAPGIDPDKPALGPADAGFIDSVVQQVGGLLERLLEEPGQPSQLRCHQGHAAHATNRRRLDWTRRSLLSGSKHVRWAPNPGGPTDDRVGALTAHAEDGALQAALWSYACHPVGAPGGQVTAEYPGVARRALREAVGAPLPVLFLQGFGGDSRPPALASPARPLGLIRRLVNGPDFGHFSPREYAEWSGSLARRVCRVVLGPGTPLREPTLRVARASVPLDRVFSGTGGDHQHLAMHLIRLDRQWSLAGLSAEVVADYVRLFRSRLGEFALMASCVGPTFGYLPSQRMLAAGGYEVEGFQPLFGLRGHFRDELEDVVRETLETLCEETAADPEETP